MPAFPKLRTDAVAQYPAGRELRFATEGVRFADGSEQRFRDAEAPVRRWTIKLDRLDETEAAEIESLFLASQGRAGHFLSPIHGTDRNTGIAASIAMNWN